MRHCLAWPLTLSCSHLLLPLALAAACRLYARYMPGVVTDFELQVRRTPLPLLTIRQEVGGSVALVVGSTASMGSLRLVRWCMLRTALPLPPCVLQCRPPVALPPTATPDCYCNHPFDCLRSTLPFACQ